MPQAPPRTYQDPDGLAAGNVDLTDPLERAAIVLQRMTFATPEDVGGMLTGERGRTELVYTWLRLKPHDRHLWRRRAAAAVAALELAELKP